MRDAPSFLLHTLLTALPLLPCPSPCAAAHSDTAEEKEVERLQCIKNILSLIWSPTGSERKY